MYKKRFIAKSFIAKSFIAKRFIATCLVSVSIFISAFILFFSFKIGIVSAATDCEATLEAWRYDVSLRNFMDTHDCSCSRTSPTSRPICTPKSTGSSRGYSTGYKGTGNWKTNMMQGLLQSFMQGFTRGLQGGGQDSFPSQAPKQPQIDMEAHERLMQERRQAWQNEMKKQIEIMQNQYASLRKEEFEDKKDRLLSRLKGPEDSSKRLTTKEPSAIRSLKCSAYWSKLASEAALSNNKSSLELARGYNENSVKAMQGDLSNCPDIKMEVSIPDASPDYSEEFKMEFLRTLTQQMNERVTAISELKVKKEEVSSKVTKAKEEVKRLDELRSNARSEEEKKEKDDLYLEALNTLKQVEEQEREVDEKFLNLSQELKALNEVNKSMLTQKKKE